MRNDVSSAVYDAVSTKLVRSQPGIENGRLTYLAVYSVKGLAKSPVVQVQAKSRPTIKLLVSGKYISPYKRYTVPLEDAPQLTFMGTLVQTVSDDFIKIEYLSSRCSPRRSSGCV